MNNNGFLPGSVTWSAPWTDASTTTTNCADVYRDYGRAINFDEITSAIGGGYIGLNSDAQVVDNLYCYGSDTSSMFKVPYYNSQPNVLDSHMYPQVVYGGSAQGQATVQQVAQLDYSDVTYILQIVQGLRSAQVIIGETYGGTLNTSAYVNGQACWGFQASASAGNVLGFNESSLASNYSVVFRPWMEIEDPSGACFGYGGGPSDSLHNFQDVNYNGQGPYVPTSH